MKILQQKKLEKKTKEENKNFIKHSWPKGTYVVIGDSMIASIDERKISSKCLIKVRSFPGATCSDMYQCLVRILEKKNPTMRYCMLEQMMLPIMNEQKLLTNCWS